MIHSLSLSLSLSLSVYLSGIFFFAKSVHPNCSRLSASSITSSQVFLWSWYATPHHRSNGSVRYYESHHIDSQRFSLSFSTGTLVYSGGLDCNRSCNRSCIWGMIRQKMSSYQLRFPPAKWSRKVANCGRKHHSFNHPNALIIILLNRCVISSSCNEQHI